MRIRTLNADGSEHQEEIALHVRDEAGELYDAPPVTIVVRMLSRERQREIQRKSVKTRVNDRTRGTYREVDEFEAGLTILEESILRWEGIEGNDGQPLTLSRKAISELPQHVIEQVNQTVRTTEAADDQAASFREPADVVRVVGGQGA